MITLRQLPDLIRQIEPSVLTWLRQRRRRECPSCRPKSAPSVSVITLSAWCPLCARVWRYRHDPAPRNAPGFWHHEIPPTSV